jgi:hypothetical protein
MKLSAIVLFHWLRKKSILNPSISHTDMHIKLACFRPPILFDLGSNYILHEAFNSRENLVKS